MKKTKINHVIEYLSPMLILSYFYINNIFLVLVGIALSFYLININFFQNILRSINKKTVTKNVSRDLNNDIKGKKSDSYKIKSSEEQSSLTLVEAIEELGFIPSINKNNDNKAA